MSKDLSGLPPSEASLSTIPVFYKVTFTPDLTPIATKLDNYKLWEQESGGLDKDKPFIIINPGNGPGNQEFQEKLANDIINPEFSSKRKEMEDVALTSIAFEAKIFERGVRKVGIPSEDRQYLVALNQTIGRPNMDLIRSHNENTAGIDGNGFTTDYTKEQARLMYGPLITTAGIAPDGSGTPLPDEQIIGNLSKARNYNPSFGTVTANCQTNALVNMMRGLDIPEETIRAGVENMRRIDAPNMAKAGTHENGIFPSTVIFEGSNDKFAEDYIGGRIPALPEDHIHTSRVTIDDHRIKVYQKLALEVYNPGKKPTQEEKAQEDMIRHSLPDSLDEEVKSSKDSLKDKILGYLSLDNLRSKDPNGHAPFLLTGEATPGNEVPGRDPNLLYKLMADMLTRENPKDVMGIFTQPQTENIATPKATVHIGNAHSAILTAAQIIPHAEAVIGISSLMDDTKKEADSLSGSLSSQSGQQIG